MTTNIIASLKSLIHLEEFVHHLLNQSWGLKCKECKKVVCVNFNKNQCRVMNGRKPIKGQGDPEIKLY